MIRNWAPIYSPFGLPGADVDSGAGRPQHFGEDIHPHLYFPLEPEWVCRLKVADLPSIR